MSDKLITENTPKGSENDPVKKKSKNPGRWLFLVAALLLVTLMIFTFVKWLFLGDDLPLTFPEVQQMYSYDKSIPKRIEDSEVFAGPEVANDIYQAQKAFEDGQFVLAIKHFNKTLTTYPNRFDLKLYTALTQIQLGKDDLAQQLLYQIINHPDKSLYANQALWYSALIDLKNNNLAGCKESLDDLIGRNTNTKELLKEAVELRELVEEW